MSCYIYQLPSWVLDDLCRNMDTLSEWDWMKFASYVITDLTELRKIKSMERTQGVSITRELLWHWGMRQATVRQLLDLLRRLELHRVAQIILDWKPIPDVKPATPVSPLGSEAEAGRTSQRQAQPPRPATPPGPGPEPATPSLLPPSESPSPEAGREAQPQQEVPWGACADSDADGLSWREADVLLATDGFHQSRRLGAGTVGEVYQGRLRGVPLAVKLLREEAGSGQGSHAKFFQAELRFCRRCCHPNLLLLLGFCAGTRLRTLVHPYMANGSLHDRLHAQDSLAPLPWPKRLRACSGLLSALSYLHGLDLVHGNVKSSNVLLDHDFSPKLAHPASPICEQDKRSRYTLTKTQLLRVSTAYLPTDFIRTGQLTRRVDVFSCGVVLAEILTGIPAMDATRNPEYLKDLLLREIPSSLCSRKADAEKAAAEELCQRFLDGRAGRLPGDCAQALALAACLCVRRRHASLAEVCGSVAPLEQQVLAQQTPLLCSRPSEATGCSSNTPEETDDVDVSSLSIVSSGEPAASAGTAAASSWEGDRQGRPQALGTGETDSAEADLQPPLNGAAGTPWRIEINEAKRKLMEDIQLYTEEKLDSDELFGP